MSKGHKGHHHGKHKKGGGRIGIVAAGNKDVIDEAKMDKDGEITGHERKRGGKVKKGKKHEMDGKEAKHRMDRPGRKRGGAVGANTSPLSTAHKAGHGADGSSDPKDTYGGTPA
jgi:hypothetical protein